ncbi:MAG: hypothetical protein KKB13_19455 [Chloroflexi bacterium]|nr:hypothetical protein [Chloroflexota bacterium]
MPVIQFLHLEQMLLELPHMHVLRVEPLEDRDTGPQHTTRVRCGVHVRAVNHDGHVLACCVYVGTFHLLGPTCMEDPTGGALQDARQEANDLACDVSEYLESVGYDVRHGVIDIGRADVIRGSWGSLPANEPPS